jgi:phosphoglucomutase/phosphomannomutase
MLGSEGMTRMRAMMARLRQEPPRCLGGLDVVGVRDYGNLTHRDARGKVTPLDARQGELVMLDLAEPGNYIGIRPSGTEPKVKFYLFTFVPAEQLADLEQTKQDMAQRLARIEADLNAFANSIE